MKDTFKYELPLDLNFAFLIEFELYRYKSLVLQKLQPKNHQMFINFGGDINARKKDKGILIDKRVDSLKAIVLIFENDVNHQ